MAKQTFTTGQVLTAAQMTSLQQTAMGGGSATAKTASYTLVAADAGTTVIMNSASATTITVNTSLFSAGDTVFIQNIGAGISTITAGTATVNTASSLALAQYASGNLYFTAAGAAIFSKADGASAAGGKVLQVVNATHNTEVTSTTNSFVDTNLTASITPSLATSKVLVLISQPYLIRYSGNGELIGSIKIVRASTDLTTATVVIRGTASGSLENGMIWSYSYLDSPATTSATAYKTQVKNNSALGDMIANRSLSSITLMEIGA